MSDEPLLTSFSRTPLGLKRARFRLARTIGNLKFPLERLEAALDELTLSELTEETIEILRLRILQRETELNDCVDALERLGYTVRTFGTGSKLLLALRALDRE